MQEDKWLDWPHRGWASSRPAGWGQVLAGSQQREGEPETRLPGEGKMQGPRRCCLADRDWDGSVRDSEPQVGLGAVKAGSG